MAIGRKGKIAFVLLILFLIVGAWQGLYYLFRHGYGEGTRTGIIRKIAVKGPPYCKYLSGEMALQGQNVAAEVFVFSADNRDEGTPLVKALQEAERTGARVTLKYRQDHPLWWRCNPSEYFVTAVEK